MRKNGKIFNMNGAKVPPNGKYRGHNFERPIHLIDSNFNVFVFFG